MPQLKNKKKNRSCMLQLKIPHATTNDPAHCKEDPIHHNEDPVCSN